MSLLENIDCQLEHCGGKIPQEDGDCCAGINDNGNCVKGKYDAKKGVCVVSKGLNAPKILQFAGLLLLLIVFLMVLYNVVNTVMRRSKT